VAERTRFISAAASATPLTRAASAGSTAVRPSNASTSSRSAAVTAFRAALSAVARAPATSPKASRMIARSRMTANPASGSGARRNHACAADVSRRTRHAMLARVTAAWVRWGGAVSAASTS
jgi:hypothetical protein